MINNIKLFKILCFLIVSSLIILPGCNSKKSMDITPIDINSHMGNIYNGGFVTQYENAIYYLNADKTNIGIYKTELNGNSKQKISDEYACCINADDTYLYYINRDNYIFKIDINGQNRQQMYAHTAINLILYNEKLYFSDTEEKGFYSMDKNGNNISLICKEDISNPVFLDDHIYYLSFDEPDTGIWRIDSSGNKESIINETVYKFFIYDNKIFYLDHRRDIKKADITGENIELIVEDAAVYDYSMNICNNVIYYERTFFRQNEICALNMDTYEEYQIPTGIHSYAVYIANNSLFCYGSKDYSLYSFDLNGKNVHKWT